MNHPHVCINAIEGNLKSTEKDINTQVILQTKFK